MVKGPELHLDALVAGTCLAVAALATQHPAPLLVLFAVVVPLAPRPRWPLLALATVGIVMNGLFAWSGETELWRAPFTLGFLGRPRITVEALVAGGVTGLQIVVAAFGIMMALSRTPPQAIARLLPGRGPRLAAHLGLRALPDLARDGAIMRDALSVRGQETDTVRGAAQLLVPLTARSLDRTVATVEVLYARGVGARPRPATPLRLGPRGMLAVAALAGLVAAFALDAWPQAELYPTIQTSALVDWRTWTPLAALAALPGVRG